MPDKVSSAYISKIKTKLKHIRKVSTVRTRNILRMIKGGSLNRSDDFRNLISAFNISLFILQLNSSDPYKRTFKKFSSE